MQYCTIHLYTYTYTYRRLQAECTLPDTCGTVQCAGSFIPFYNDCSGLVGGSQEYQDFFANCQELKAQSAQMLLQPVTVQMFKVHIATNVMAGPPPSPPTSSSGDSSSALQEYHAVYNDATIMSCVPACNATTHGYATTADECAAHRCSSHGRCWGDGKMVAEACDCNLRWSGASQSALECVRRNVPAGHQALLVLWWQSGF